MGITTGFLVLFLTALVGCVVSSDTTCPNFEDIYPCICAIYQGNGHMVVACPVLKIPYKIQTLKRILRNLQGKNNVDLLINNFELDRISSKLFDGVEIKRLEFQDSYIEALSDEEGEPAFAGLENSLESLSFLNSLDAINSKNIATSLHHLRRLQSVEFKFKKSTKFSNRWFEGGLDSLEVLRIHGHALSTVGDRAVSTLKNLKEFELSNTKVKNVQRSLLPDPAQNLETLILSENKLASLPEDFFNNMPSLKSVNVYKNRIAKLDESTWKPVWQQLEFFNILRNPLECDSSIDWIFNLRKPKSVNGNCVAPLERKEKQLNQLYEQKEKEKKNNV